MRHNDEITTAPEQLATTRRELREFHRRKVPRSATLRQRSTTVSSQPKEPHTTFRSAARKLAVSFTVLLVTVGMAAVYALPGYSSESVPQESVAALDGIATQSLVSATGGSSTFLRDDYTVALAPKIRSVNRQSAYASLARTFINNPNSAIQWPFTVGVPISSGFGPRIAPCSACSSFHDGIDMTPGLGTPIQAIADGVVREVSTTDRGGLGVYAIIDHSIDGQLVSSLYAHMLTGSLQLRVGQSVRVSQLVGNVGNTGISTGAHLHLGILLGGAWPTYPFV